MHRHVVTIDGYEDVPKNDEFALKQAAASQPVAVAICASPAMQFYSGGIIDTCCEVSALLVMDVRKLALNTRHVGCMAGRTVSQHVATVNCRSF